MFHCHPAGRVLVQSLDSLIPASGDFKAEKIKEVWKRGLFSPYEEEFSKTNPSDFGGKNWFKCIRRIAEGRENLEEIDLQFCYMTAVIIDPEISEKEKKALLENAHKSVAGEELNKFIRCFCFLPPVMGANLLRFGTKDLLEEVAGRILKFRCVYRYQEFFKGWMEAAVQSRWTNDEKSGFLDKTLEALPEAEADDLLYYFLLHASPEIRQQLYETCSSALKERIEKLKEEAVQFGSEMLSAEKPKYIHFNGYKRFYLVAWFHDNALTHEKGSFVAAGFDENDWEWLQKRMEQEDEAKNRLAHSFSFCRISSSLLTPFAMKWMTDIARRLNSRELVPEVQLKLFFIRASEAIKKEKGWKYIPEENWRVFAEALRGEDFCYFFKNFGKYLRENTLDHFLKDDPEKLLSCSLTILERDEPDCCTKISEKLSEIYALIAKRGHFEGAVSIIFNPEQENHALKASIYCLLDSGCRKQVLTYMLLTGGVDSLAPWVKLCMLETSGLKPFVRDEFSKDFCILLQEIDPSAAGRLRGLLEEDLWIKASPENRESLNSILPAGADLSDPSMRQKMAIEKIGRCFQTKGKSYNEIFKIVRSLQKDLEAGEETSAWLLNLLNGLPDDTWPFVFLYFEADATHACRDSKFLSENWPVMAVSALVQFVDNPYLDDYIDNALHSLFRLLMFTGTLKEVLLKLSETAPEIFAPVINFAVNFEDVDKEELEEILSCALDKKEDRIAYSVDCMLAQTERRILNGQRIFLSGYTAIEKLLWKSPYLRTPEERSAAAKILINRMGIGFLSCFSLFSGYRIPVKTIIKNLKITDPEYLRRFFYRWMNELCTEDVAQKFKMEIFGSLCDEYSAVGFDILGMIKHEDFRGSHPAVREWFSSKALVDFYLKNRMAGNIFLGLSLLKFFHKEDFYPAIFRKINEAISREYTLYIELEFLFEALEKLDCKEEMLQKFFDGQPELLASMKEFIQTHLAECFKKVSSPTGISFVCHLVPDWKKRLSEWMLARIEEDKKMSMKSGKKSDHSSLIKLNEAFEKNGLLKDFQEGKTIFKELTAHEF